MVGASDLGRFRLRTLQDRSSDLFFLLLRVAADRNSSLRTVRAEEIVHGEPPAICLKLAAKQVGKCSHHYDLFVVILVIRPPGGKEMEAFLYKQLPRY